MIVSKILKKFSLKNKVAIVTGGSVQIVSQTIEILLDTATTFVSIDYLK